MLPVLLSEKQTTDTPATTFKEQLNLV